MKNNLFLYLFCLFLTSCWDKAKNDVFLEEIAIECQPVNYPDLIGIGMQLIKTGDYLILNDFHGDSLLSVFNLKNNTIEKHLILRGNGPEEMISPIDAKLNDNNLYLLCRPLFNMGRIPIKNICAASVQIEDRIQLPQKSDKFLPLNDSLFVFSGMWDKRFALYKKNQQHQADSITEFGDYPSYWENEKTIPNTAKAMFHQCEFVKHPSQPLFAACSRYVLDIYKYDEKGKTVPQELIRKQLGTYAYDFVAGDVISTKVREDSSPIVRHVACDENYLYMVKRPESGSSFHYIYVYDWQGNPIKVFKTDKSISNITVDDSANKIYAIIEDPEDTLVVFNIPQ